MSDENSEWFVEVVRITSVQKHPGADRLELVRFATKDGETGYTVVDRAGTWRVGKGDGSNAGPGEWAVYCAVDSMLPLDDWRWAFLRPKDYVVGSGKTHRLKAARLRGVYSEGILTEASVCGPSAQVDAYKASRAKGPTIWAEVLGITKYEAPEVGSALTPAGVKVSDGTLGGKFPIYRIQNLKKAPHYFTADESVVVTEKIHGTNARYMWEPGRGLCVGSHRVVKVRGKTVAQSLVAWLKKLLTFDREEFKPDGYYGEDLWSGVARKYDLATGLADYPNTVLYGEIYGKTESGANIQDLTYGVGSPKFRVFDAYDSARGEWLGYRELALMASDLGINMAPVLYRGFYNPAVVAQLAEGSTTVGPENGYPTGDTCIPAPHVREGVVVRGWGRNSKVAKYVGEGYKLRKGA